MNIFVISGDIDFGLIHAGNRDDVLACLQNAVGRPVAQGWVVPRLEPQIYRKKLYTMWVDCLASVVPNGTDILLNRRARDLLSPLLLKSGELLPVYLDSQDYHWFNCVTFLDGVVDNANTKGSRFKCGDVEVWDRVTDWAFYADRLTTAPAIFRVPEDPFRRLFCSDALVNKIRSSDLIGFDIKKVWMSESVATDEPPMSFPAEFDFSSDYERRDEIKAKRRAAMAALAKRAG